MFLEMSFYLFGYPIIFIALALIPGVEYLENDPLLTTLLQVIAFIIYAGLFYASL
jgi:hypothetical protein